MTGVMLHCPCRREETTKRVSSSVDVAILSRPVFNLGVIAFLYTYLNKLYLRIFYCSKIYTGCLKRVLRKLIIVEILHHHLSCELILQLKNVYLEDSTFFIMTPNQPNFGVTITLHSGAFKHGRVGFWRNRDKYHVWTYT